MRGALDPRVARLGGLGAVVVVAVGLPWVVTNFQSLEMSYVLTFAIALLGLNVLTGYSGQISLGQSAFIAVGAFVMAIGVQRYNMNYLATIPIAALAAGAIGFLVGLPALRLEGIYLALATFALGVGFPDLLRKPVAITGGVKGIIVPPVISPVDWLQDEQYFYYVCLLVAAVVFVLVWLLLRGRTGRAWRALRDNDLAARSSGVNLSFYKTLAFAVSAACAGVAGALLGLNSGFVSADAYQVQLGVALLVGSIIGGVASIEGAVIGAAFTYFLPIYAQQLLFPINRELANAAPGATQGALLLFVMFVARDGVAGLIRSAYHRLRTRVIGRPDAVAADADAMPTAV